MLMWDETDKEFKDVPDGNGHVTIDSMDYLVKQIQLLGKQLEEELKRQGVIE